ncbi:MAG: stage III sporulation protein AE [Clostridia bacterium]|nr:stage III sporulation protein AE [Clostridia bacterium]
MAFAQESSEQQGADKLNQIIIEQLGKLDLEALQAYVDSLGNFTNESVVERLIAYISGTDINYESMGRQFMTILFAKVWEIVPVFACIAAITLLSGFVSTMQSNSNTQTTSNMSFFITYAATLIPLLAVLIECFQTSIDCVNSMQKQMQIIFPLMLTLMAASGGSLSASVCRPAVAFFATNIVSIIRSVVFPITITIIVFSMIGNFAKDFKMNKFTAFFKSINKWVIGICVSAFGLFFTLQGITAANYDGVVRRAAKYAIGNGIPIVGGFLSGGFDLAVAGSVLIKNSLGSMSIFLLLTVLFEPLILLLSVHLLLRLTSALTQPFGDGRISDFLGETAENLNYCTAGLLFTAFLYFISIMLMVYVSEVLF